jgi:hypothetical protein
MNSERTTTGKEEENVGKAFKITESKFGVSPCVYYRKGLCFRKQRN